MMRHGRPDQLRDDHGRYAEEHVVVSFTADDKPAGKMAAIKYGKQFRGVFTNLNTGWPIHVNAATIKEVAYHHNVDFRILSAIESLVKHAILFLSADPREEDDESAKIHYLEQLRDWSSGIR